MDFRCRSRSLARALADPRLGGDVPPQRRLGLGIVATKGTDAAEFAANKRGLTGEADAVAVARKAALAPQPAMAPMAPVPMADGMPREGGEMPADFADAAKLAAEVGPRGDQKFKPAPNMMPPVFAGRPQGVDLKVGPKGLPADRAAMNKAKEQFDGRLLPARPIRGDRPRAGKIPVAGPMMGAPAEPMAPERDMMFVDEAAVAPEMMSFVVREYAHERNPSLPADVRSDFTETVYWNPVLVLPGSGKASVEFQLSDDIARYQVLVAGHTTDGRIGAITKTIEARKPFSLDPRLPLEISHTDKIDVPIRVTNDSDVKRSVQYLLATNGLKVEGKAEDFFDLAPNAKGRRIVRMMADNLQGDASVFVTGVSTGAEKDTIERKLKITPDGFPGVGSFSDTIEGKTRGSVRLPKDMVPGSLKVRLEVYPTSMADLVNGLEGLLREPCGCFEQTSTSNYPNTLILDYMTSTNQVNPQASARAKTLLGTGYAKLVSFECPDTPQRVKQGFEWFGQADNQHEALTAYGLLQFKDMARVHPVNPELIRRTQDFLMSRRDGNGGFKRNARAIDQFGGAPKHTTDAYIVWALVESDPDDNEKLDLKKEIAAIKAEALKEDSVGGKDAYFVALVANVLLQRGDRESAHKLLDRLQEKHTKDGVVTGAETSITRSSGRDLQIETTSLALVGWLRANDPRYGMTVKAATKWISQQRGGYGGFGSTQSTILELKALIFHAKKSARPAESGELKVLVGGKEIASRRFSEKDVEVIGLDIPNAEAIFIAGENTEVEILTDAKQAYPFALSYTYTTLTPASSKQCAVRIETKLSRIEANEGDTVPLFVNFENLQASDQGMAVAIVGLPAGLKVPTDMKQLTDLREKGTISYFEIRGRELVLYWRALAPQQKIALTVDLVCDVPGVYRGPASRGYLYYNADHKHWVEPLAVKVAQMVGNGEK
ncbi:MAG: alpha-2-macroglobulin family protein [Gemmataceae bacterium]